VYLSFISQVGRLCICLGGHYYIRLTMDQSQWADPPASDYHLPPSETFAQTGPQQDDLFDDIVPEAEAMRLRSDEDLFNDDFVPVAEPIVEPVIPVAAPAAPATVAPATANNNRGHGEGQRSRGRGRGRGQASSHQSSNGNPRSQPQSQSNAPENAPTGPRKETAFAVRGDRQATGGVRKPKLTEEELAEKLASMQIKNASITAAHARAEADAASFAEREQQAKKDAELKRKEERKDRQQMMGEREKNRQRKLKAMTGREWDAEKDEDDFGKGGKFDKRGAPQGEAGLSMRLQILSLTRTSTTAEKDTHTDGREYIYQEGRGERGRGRGGARGGRGGRPAEPTVPKQEDFPALPGNTAAAEHASSAAAKPLPIPDESGRSWADQVESPTLP
jgi:hypothetical protein